MLGGVSQVDTFDPKPALAKFDNTVMDWSKEKNTDQPNLFAKPRLILKSPWEFKKYGKCGMDVSALYPNIAGCVDDMTFVRSVQAENGNHPAAVFLMNTGSVIPGRPSMGAWVTYGLGTENQNLPAFVVLPDFRSLPFSGSQQWGSAFLPAAYQGTVLRWKGEADSRSQTSSQRNPGLAGARDGSTPRVQSPVSSNSTRGNPDLQGRMDAYELAYRMQTEVPGVISIDGENEKTRDMYGLNDPTTESFGKRCLMARKLVEKGVRFVQIYTPSQSWDSHTDILKGHQKNASEDG